MPREAHWTTSLALLPYDVVRESADPRSTLLGFLESAYRAGADSASWDQDDLRSSWCPTVPELDELLGIT